MDGRQSLFVKSSLVYLLHTFLMDLRFQRKSYLPVCTKNTLQYPPRREKGVVVRDVLMKKMASMFLLALFRNGKTSKLSRAQLCVPPNRLGKMKRRLRTSFSCLSKTNRFRHTNFFYKTLVTICTAARVMKIKR